MSNPNLNLNSIYTFSQVEKFLTSYPSSLKRSQLAQEILVKGGILRVQIPQSLPDEVSSLQPLISQIQAQGAGYSIMPEVKASRFGNRLWELQVKR